jgi:hypothetical protein
MPFTLVTPKIGLHRYGPLLTVIVHWHILQVSSRSVGVTSTFTVRAVASPQERDRPSDHLREAHLRRGRLASNSRAPQDPSATGYS